MPIDLEALEPAPAGFDACASCAYRVTGTPAICFSCIIAGGAAPDAWPLTRASGRLRPAASGAHCFWTLTAFGPLSPCSSSYETRVPSASDR